MRATVKGAPVRLISYLFGVAVVTRLLYPAPIGEQAEIYARNIPAALIVSFLLIGGGAFALASNRWFGVAAAIIVAVIGLIAVTAFTHAGF